MLVSVTDRDFEGMARDLLQKFRHLWDVRDPQLIADIVAPEAHSHWSGLGPVAGADYPAQWQSLVEMPDEVEHVVTGHAATDPYLYISWHVTLRFGEEVVEYDGVDRFTITDGPRASEVYVVFDTAPVRDVMRRRATSPQS